MPTKITFQVLNANCKNDNNNKKEYYVPILKGSFDYDIERLTKWKDFKLNSTKAQCGNFLNHMKTKRYKATELRQKSAMYASTFPEIVP